MERTLQDLPPSGLVGWPIFREARVEDGDGGTKSGVRCESDCQRKELRNPINARDIFPKRCSTGLVAGDEIGKELESGDAVSQGDLRIFILQISQHIKVANDIRNEPVLVEIERIFLRRDQRILEALHDLMLPLPISSGRGVL
jgi:hypothetical protein